MNLLSLEGFEANLRFKVASVEVFEGHHKTFETETDFRILQFVSQKTHNPIAKQLKTAKTGQDFKIRSPKVVTKGFLRQDLRF